MKYNLLSLMTPISLIGIAFLVYSLGTSIVFISFSQQLQLSYLIALICFMPIGFMLIPHEIWSLLKGNRCSFSLAVLFMSCLAYLSSQSLFFKKR